MHVAPDDSASPRHLSQFLLPVHVVCRRMNFLIFLLLLMALCSPCGRTFDGPQAGRNLKIHQSSCVEFHAQRAAQDKQAKQTENALEAYQKKRKRARQDTLAPPVIPAASSSTFVAPEPEVFSFLLFSSGTIAYNNISPMPMLRCCIRELERILYLPLLSAHLLLPEVVDYARSARHGSSFRVCLSHLRHFPILFPTIQFLSRYQRRRRRTGCGNLCAHP
jgi:hypothetical protein